MKAFVYEKYGSPDVLQLRETDTPTPSDDEVLVRVRAASVNPLDWHFIRGEPYLMRLMTGLRKPRANRPGADVAGQVEAVGKGVTRFRPGDEVFGNIAEGRWGSFAEYACVPEDWLEQKPANTTFEQAAAVPIAGLTALQGLRDWGRIEAGQKVLIIGALGGVGSFAVQIAKHLGAEVTGVCSTSKVEMVCALGADHVVDYTREDFTNAGRRYDLVFELAGTHSASHCRQVVTPHGTLVLSSGEGGPWIGPLLRMMAAIVASPFVGQKMVMRVAQRSKTDLLYLKDLIEAGTVTPVIDRQYAFEDTPDAMRYLEQGHAAGKIVITVNHSDTPG